MKKKIFYKGLVIGLILMGNIFIAGFSQNKDTLDFPKLKGPYLGQKPPGLIPEVFAPGIISTEATEGCCCFSKDGNLFLFVRLRSSEPGIFIMEQIDGIWTKPKLAPFSAGKYDWDFMLSPDDKSVYISSRRPHIEGGPPQNANIWISDRKNGTWSKAYLMPPPVNTGQYDSYPCPTINGELFFFSRRKGGFGRGDIYRFNPKGGDKYPKLKNIGPPVNTKYDEADPFIPPDESYLIFITDKTGGFGKYDFYISFKTKNDTWGEPVNLGKKVNTPYSDYIPYVTPDGKYFFFTSDHSGNREIYWVDAKFLNQFKKKK